MPRSYRLAFREAIRPDVNPVTKFGGHIFTATPGLAERIPGHYPVSYTHLDVYKRQALAEGGAALAPDAPAAFAPDRLSLTYWYVSEPDAPRVIRYDAATHRRNLAEVEGIVAEIDRQLSGGDWPKTDDWAQCRHCAYRVYCARQAAGAAQPDETEDEDADLFDAELEPQWG